MLSVELIIPVTVIEAIILLVLCTVTHIHIHVAKHVHHALTHPAVMITFTPNFCFHVTVEQLPFNKLLQDLLERTLIGNYGVSCIVSFETACHVRCHVS